MVHRSLAVALALIAGHAIAGRATAQETAPPPDYPAVPLLSTGTSIIGETIRYPKTGRAHVTAAIVTLAPGGRTIVHKHGVPLFAYILDGELTVDYGKHGKRTYLKGQTFMEAMNAPHSASTPARSRCACWRSTWAQSMPRMSSRSDSSRY